MSEPCSPLSSVWSSVSIWLQRVTESNIRRSCRFILISKRTTMIQQKADKSKLNAEKKVLWSRFCPFLCFSFSLWEFIAKIEHQGLRTSEDFDVWTKRAELCTTLNFLRTGCWSETRYSGTWAQYTHNDEQEVFLFSCKGQQRGQEIEILLP